MVGTELLAFTRHNWSAWLLQWTYIMHGDIFLNNDWTPDFEPLKFEAPSNDAAAIFLGSRPWSFITSTSFSHMSDAVVEAKGVTQRKRSTTVELLMYRTHTLSIWQPFMSVHSSASIAYSPICRMSVNFCNDSWNNAFPKQCSISVTAVVERLCAFLGAAFNVFLMDSLPSNAEIIVTKSRHKVVWGNSEWNKK